MERNAKRILALVIIAVIATGGIAGVILLQQIEEPPTWVTPGAPGDVTDDQLIKIGILGPLSDVQGKGMYRGAYLRAWEINAAGGVMVNGTRMYVSIAKQDTKESASDPLAETAVNAVDKLINVKGAEYIIGGFRTESVIIYMEDVMDTETMFLDVGAADQSLMQGLNDSSPQYDYDRYKYFFRTMPHNSELQGYDVIEYIKFLANEVPVIAEEIGTGPYQYVNTTENNFNITKIAYIRENLDWTEGFATAITGGLNATGDIEVLQFEYAPTATYTDFAGYWNAIEAFGAQITIPICSSAGSKPMMQAYADIEPHCMVAGVDVPGSESTFWGATGGDCNGEVVAASGAGLNVSYGALASSFYTAYVSNYSVSPLYTATGAYDAVGMYCIAMNATGSLDSDVLVTAFESWNWMSPLYMQTAAAPRFCFMDDSFRTLLLTAAGGAYAAYAINPHDVIGGYLGGLIAAFSSGALPNTGYYNVFFGQWQDGELLAVEGPGAASNSYPASLAQANLTLPSQGLNGLPTGP